MVVMIAFVDSLLFLISLDLYLWCGVNESMRVFHFQSCFFHGISDVGMLSLFFMRV